MNILFKKLNENAVIPFQKHKGEDACYDLIATSYKYNPKYDRFEYGLGFATEFTPDWEAEIRPRSTNTRKMFIFQMLQVLLILIIVESGL